MSETSRLFFALWPDAITRDKVAALAHRFHEDYGGRMVARDSLHVTLAFLGETPNIRLAELDAIGRGVTTPMFNLVLNCAGCWSGGIFWFAPEATPTPLLSLATTLHDKLTAAHVRFDNSKRFVPHMTVLRRAGFRGQQIAIAPIEFMLHDFVLVRSVSTSKGVNYEVINRFPLGTSD